MNINKSKLFNFNTVIIIGRLGLDPNLLLFRLRMLLLKIHVVDSLMTLMKSNRLNCQLNYIIRLAVFFLFNNNLLMSKSLRLQMVDNYCGSWWVHRFQPVLHDLFSHLLPPHWKRR